MQTTTYIYDGHTGRLLVVSDKHSVQTDFFPDGFVTVIDRRGQKFTLKHPVVIEETTTGNGDYITVYWFDAGHWRTSRYQNDADSASRHMATAGFALRYKPDYGEHRVVTLPGTEWYPTRGVIITATLGTAWLPDLLVPDDAQVFGGARISGDARVCGDDACDPDPDPDPVEMLFREREALIARLRARSAEV